MTKPRIYIAVAEFHPSLGGTEQQARLQARLLRERGFETTVVTFRLARSWCSRDEVDGVPVFRVAGWLLADRNRRPAPLRKIAYLMALVVMGWTLWRRRQHYDVLHVYKLNALALVSVLACQVVGKPMLVAVRSTGLDDAPLPQSDFSGVSPTSDGSVPVVRAPERARLVGDLEDLERYGPIGVRLCRDLLRRNGAVVIALSSRIQTYLAEHDFDLPHGELIPNGVDAQRFHPSPQIADGADRDTWARTVICVSKLRYQKGVDVLLRAWRLVQNEAPWARLIIVGDGPMREPLQHLAAELGIEDTVDFTGRRSDVPELLHRAGLAVLSSRYEGMPNAILEAMASGLPCVATRVSGSEDLIQPNVNGFLVEPEDVHGLADGMLTLLLDPAKAQAWGRVSRTVIEQRFAVDRIMDQYVTLYARLAGRDRHHDSDAAVAVEYEAPARS